MALHDLLMISVNDLLDPDQHNKACNTLIGSETALMLIYTIYPSETVRVSVNVSSIQFSYLSKQTLYCL